jgi:hypothetical protein
VENHHSTPLEADAFSEYQTRYGVQTHPAAWQPAQLQPAVSQSVQVQFGQAQLAHAQIGLPG